MRQSRNALKELKFYFTGMLIFGNICDTILQVKRVRKQIGLMRGTYAVIIVFDIIFAVKYKDGFVNKRSDITFKIANKDIPF